MYYEINVALNGKHFFATHERSITNYDKLKIVFAELDKRFPSEEGFELGVSRRSLSGSDVDLAELRKSQ